MKITAQLKLLPTPEQVGALQLTLQAANVACNPISAVAWETRMFGTFPLQKQLYQDVRDTFNLGAQLAIRCIAKVANAYKRIGSLCVCSSPRWQLRLMTVPSLGTSRVRRFRSGRLMDDRRSHSSVVNALATDSDGEHISGEQVERRRQWYTSRRQALQKVGAPSAKRRLRQLTGRQRRFQKDTNHIISKRLVAKAERTKRAIALEDVRGMRQRARVGGPQQRACQSNWAFGQMRMYISYKAQQAGVPVSCVDPSYTSQRCSACGHTERRNRRSQTALRYHEGAGEFLSHTLRSVTGQRF
ncbi:MAG: transposase [Chloroflexales bacterium]|nr:transposase [Chloroflexales bacterium]